MPVPDKNPANLNSTVESSSSGEAVWRDVYTQGDPYYKDEDPYTTTTNERRPTPTESESTTTTRTWECRDIISVQPMRRRYQRYYIEEYAAQTRTSTTQILGWGFTIVSLIGVVAGGAVGFFGKTAAQKAAGFGAATVSAGIGGVAISVVQANPSTHSRGAPKGTGYFLERPIGEPEKNGAPAVTTGPWHPCP